MTEKELEIIIRKRCDSIIENLNRKGLEYSRNRDPLHNFNVGSRISGLSREKVVWGFALKHYISFLDMLDDVSLSRLPTEDYVDEKIGDLINYLILCEASIKDKIKKDGKPKS